MGVSTSEVGYISATARRETTKSMTDMWWHWETITNNIFNIVLPPFKWSLSDHVSPPKPCTHFLSPPYMPSFLI
jgi:hypothetical protein